MKLSLSYEVKPFKINQQWGVSNPSVYSRFGFTEHNGTDVALGNDSLVYAPAKGTIIKSSNHPTGGGIFIGFLLDDLYTFDDGVTCHVLVDYLHLEKVIALVGTSYEVGSVLAKADNTGFSTGPHTHIQYRRGEWNGNVFIQRDRNEANNSFDPTPFYNGYFAKDSELVVNILGKIIETLTKMIASFKK